MASSSRDKNENAVVQFIGADGRRRSIRVGKISDARVEIIRSVEFCVLQSCTVSALTAKSSPTAKMEDPLQNWRRRPRQVACVAFGRFSTNTSPRERTSRQTR